MTRECATDFKKIKGYINDYSISENIKQDEYISSLKKMHKCYFSTVTWNAELMHNKDIFLNLNGSSNNDIIYRLSEAVSDLGSSLFNWSNGNYKASRVMLRVSIENFVRGVSGVEESDQLTEKNVYKLFETASTQNVFTDSSTVNKCYRSLHSDYKLLCKDTHTAALQNMAHLSSLADLPKFEKEKSNKASEVFVRTSKNITAIFNILFNSFYQQMHHRNKENIINCLSGEIKPFVVSPKS